jgi:hypothetical protein
MERHVKKRGDATKWRRCDPVMVAYGGDDR